MDPTKESCESLNKKDKYFQNFELEKKSPELESYKKVPRKREIRKRLPGYTCSCCKRYYECLDLDEKKLKLRLKRVSKHRVPSPPKTPEHFWELEFPENDECLKRGYIEEPKAYCFKK